MPEVTLNNLVVDARLVTRREYDAFASYLQPPPTYSHCDPFFDWQEPFYVTVPEAVEPPPLDGPAVHITWCQARGYCAWAGKHLCGKIGGGILTNEDLAPAVRASRDEWYSACSSGDPQLENMPPQAISEWINGIAEVDGASGAVAASRHSPCEDWALSGLNAGGLTLAFRCCSDPSE